MCRGGSRTAATSKMERFVMIVNGWKPLTIITKSYHKALHLGCCSSPRSASGNGCHISINTLNLPIKLATIWFKFMKHFLNMFNDGSFKLEKLSFYFNKSLRLWLELKEIRIKPVEWQVLLLLVKILFKEKWGPCGCINDFESIKHANLYVYFDFFKNFLVRICTWL